MISIVIPVKDRALQIARTVEDVTTVLRESRLEGEVIVVDDASDPPVSFSKKYDNLVLVRHSYNQGVSAARNTGVRNARYPIISFLDSDDKLLATKLAFCAQYPDLNGADAVIGGQLALCPNGEKKQIYNAPWTGDVNSSLASGWVPNNPSSTLIKKDAYLAAGGMLEGLDTCEDHEFWLRFSLRFNYIVGYVGDIFSQFSSDQRSDRLSLNYQKRHRGMTQLFEIIKERQYIDDYKNFENRYRFIVAFPFLSLHQILQNRKNPKFFRFLLWNIVFNQFPYKFIVKRSINVFDNRSI